MKKDISWSLDKPSQLQGRVIELRQQLAGRDFSQLARLTAAKFVPASTHQGRFEFLYWNEQVFLPTNDFIPLASASHTPLSIPHQAIILYYFNTADGSPLLENWISFSDLPEGRFYNQAFQGYTGKVLLQRFGSDVALLEKAALRSSGVPYPFADKSFCFQLFPRVQLLLVFWQGDEDFPPNIQILFTSNSPSYLPTDACAIAGSMLTRKLITNS